MGVKKKINLLKIRFFSLKLQVKLGIGQFPKHLGMKIYITFVIVRGLKIKHILLESTAYTKIISLFQNICHMTNLLNF